MLIILDFEQGHFGRFCEQLATVLYSCDKFQLMSMQTHIAMS